MKNSENLRKLLQAMNGFNTAYCYLLSEIKHYEHETKSSVNDIPGFTESYPFDKSFEELQVNNWLNTVVDNVRKKAFKVLHYDYLNTGGGTMVGIFTVWVPALSQTVYALTNEVGCTLTTVDYISNDIDIDDYDAITIDACDFDDLQENATYFDLYRHCLIEYTKSDCRHTGHTYALPYHLLSDELQSKVSPEYRTWCDENNGGCIPTNGKEIVLHPDYDPPVCDREKMLRNFKNFKEWHDATAGDEELYPYNYIITLKDHTVVIPYGADEFSHIDDLLESVIENW